MFHASIGEACEHASVLRDDRFAAPRFFIRIGPLDQFVRFADHCEAPRDEGLEGIVLGVVVSFVAAPTGLILTDRRAAAIVSKDGCGGANAGRLSGQSFICVCRVPITADVSDDHLES